MRGADGGVARDQARGGDGVGRLRGADGGRLVGEARRAGAWAAW